MERLWLVAALAARCSAELSAIAVESAETLTVKKFRARYVRHQLPVIIRPSLNAPNWTHLDFKRMCGAGPITRYEVQPELNQWGGLGVGVPMELDKMIEELYAKNVRTYYGFGFDLKCGCPPFTEKAELLKIFEEDRYKHSEFGKSNWPELIVGSKDSFTALHVDKGMMPFWLKLIEGEKDFRVVPLPEWRGKLDGSDDAGAPFVGGPFPSLKAPFDAFDDALVERKVEAEVLCLRERVAAQTEAIATASSHKFNMDELDGVIGDIEASHAMERQERLKLQERLAALTKIGDLDRSRIAALEDDLNDWEARRGQLERLEALSPAKPHSDAHAGASKLQAAYRGKTVRAKAKQPPDDAAKVATFVRAAIRGSFAQLVARGGP